MRGWKKPPEAEAQERFLGEIAPLLAAARPLESLSSVEWRQVRKRILRTLFGTRSVRLRGRLLPALMAIAFLVIGGAAFATAHRLGLLPGLGGPKAGPSDRAAETPKRKKPRSRPRGVAVPGPGADGVVDPESQPAAPPAVLPEPPLLTSPPSGDSQRTQVPGPTAAARTTAAGLAPTPPAPKPAGRPGRRRAMSGSPVPAAASVDRPAPVIPAPPEQPVAQVIPSSMVAHVPAAPTFILPAAPGIPTAAPALPAAPPSVSAAKPLPAAAPVAAPAAPPAAKPSSDQALFGQALRKLRAGHDAAGALAALREHGKAFPRSALAGERQALEVEALLALHRDRDALALLDTMELNELPRSGERLVVRGELRATAKRWPEAHADFDRALARVSGSPAWHERALWGRGVARLRLGEREAGLADVERYRDSYPKGRFAAEAARLLSRR